MICGTCKGEREINITTYCRRDGIEIQLTEKTGMFTVACPKCGGDGVIE